MLKGELAFLEEMESGFISESEKEKEKGLRRDANKWNKPGRLTADECVGVFKVRQHTLKEAECSIFTHVYKLVSQVRGKKFCFRLLGPSARSC